MKFTLAEHNKALILGRKHQNLKNEVAKAAVKYLRALTTYNDFCEEVGFKMLSPCTTEEQDFWMVQKDKLNWGQERALSEVLNAAEALEQFEAEQKNGNT